jgi:hypothetical protein
MWETFEKKRDKVLRAGTGGVSRALEALLGKTVGACSQDQARIGPPPSDRLQSVYEEADLVEEWVEERLEAGLDIREAGVEAVKWLREDAGGGVIRQELLKNPQSRSIVRQQLRAALRQHR